uniref:Succinate dehydrogenase assembly factor 4, mitochondrial n=1 Tax=Panagrolaimus sp. PS1159 TaxID=55785 RepID=A0AC35GNI9_9BILA
MLRIFHTRQIHFIRAFSTSKKQPPLAGRTPVGEFDVPSNAKEEEEESEAPRRRLVNPETGEIGGPQGPEPTRYGDWERKGRVSDF